MIQKFTIGRERKKYSKSRIWNKNQNQSKEIQKREKPQIGGKVEGLNPFKNF